MKLDFSWGEPYFLAQPLNVVTRIEAGYPKLIKNCPYISDLIYRHVGVRFKYIHITNGATGALNHLMRVLNGTVGYRKPCFSYYDQILKRNNKIYQEVGSEITIVDSPSNPYGFINDGKCTIWDSVYHTPVFTDNKRRPASRILVGSVSKSLGLASLRVGWIAHNEDLLANKIENDIVTETAHLPTIGHETLVRFLDRTNLDLFEEKAKGVLDFNKEIVDKLAIGTVYENSMFMICDKLLEKEFSKRNIIVTDLGDKLRVNLGQTPENIFELVRRFRVSSDKSH